MLESIVPVDKSSVKGAVCCVVTITVAKKGV